MSAHLCLPRQLPCSFSVEIVELPLTPPHAWYVHAKNRGKLISPTWNLFIKLSQFLVCRGNRLTGRGRMKTQGRWHFIDIICTKSCYCQCLQLSPFLLLFCITKNYARWPMHPLFTMLGILGPCISLFGYGTKSHTQTKWLTTELIGGDITTRQNHEPSSPPSAPGGGGASGKSSRIPINYMLPVPHSALLPPNAKRTVRSCWTSLQEWMWVWDYRYVVVLVIPLQAFCWLWLPVACDVIVIW